MAALCPDCSGNGGKMVDCTICGGNGTVPVFGTGGKIIDRVKCNGGCNGGDVKLNCPACGGRGTR